VSYSELLLLSKFVIELALTKHILSGVLAARR